MKRPQHMTPEERAALPDALEFERKKVLIDTPKLAKKYSLKLGDTLYIPIARRAFVAACRPGDLMFWEDASGDLWTPVWLGDDVGWGKRRFWL